MRNILYLVFVTIAFATANGEEECARKRSGNKLLDQDFGLEITDDLISSMMTPWMLRDYIRPWRYLESWTRDLGSTIKTEKDTFTINLDVQHFGPNEINVRTADGYVLVEAKHEEKKDEHGFVSRQFMRKYALPEGVESEDIISQLSSDGILTITAPRKEIDAKGERVVPITQTGPIRKEAKESKKEEYCSADEKCNK